MITTRRNLLTSAAGLGVVALAGCTTTTDPTTGVVTLGLNASVTDFIQSAVAAAAKYIPTVESIVATAAGLFGSQYAAIVTAGSAALNAVVSALTNVVTQLVPAAQAKMRARLRASSPTAPVAIGSIVVNGGTVITVHGYQI